jgi:uncharacterized protein
VVWVPEGADIELDLRLESVMEGVLATATAQARYTGECARCLDPVEDELTVDVQQLYVYDPSEPDHDDETAEDDMPVVDDMIDLEQPVRDAVVLALPHSPLCRDDCPGLCAQCGARLADEPGHEHDETDPRWAALTGLLADDETKPGPNGAGSTKES